MENKSTELEKSNSASPRVSAETSQERWYVPRADIFEREDALVLMVDLPGVEEKGVNIDLEEGDLTITGYVAPCTFPRHELQYREYREGSFKRSFSILADVDEDRIQASLRNGVLRVELPKSEKAKPKRIAVKSA